MISVSLLKKQLKGALLPCWFCFWGEVPGTREGISELSFQLHQLIESQFELEGAIKGRLVRLCNATLGVCRDGAALPLCAALIPSHTTAVLRPLPSHSPFRHCSQEGFHPWDHFCSSSPGGVSFQVAEMGGDGLRWEEMGGDGRWAEV